jgi:DNA mismatch repair protein MutS
MSDDTDLKKIYPYYVERTNNYKSIYGNNTVVLMQVGSFYEIYSDCKSDDIDIKGFSEITQLAVANKKIGYYMAGFKIEILQKYANILTNAGYTCVIYDQIGEQTQDGKEKRGLREIISPGTNINCKDEVSNLIIFYLEDNSMGCVVLNVLSNKCFILESHSTVNDRNKAFNDILRIITIHKPTEVLITSLNDNYDINKIFEMFSQSTIIHNKVGKMNKEYTKLDYQKQVLIKAYNYKSIADIIDYLDLNYYPIALIALINTIQFVYERNPNIIKNIEKPIYIDNDDIFKLDYDSAIQLNYVDHKENSVVKIINKCYTAMGRRAMNTRLIYPKTNEEILNKEYDLIEKYLTIDLSDPINNLKQIHDIERFYRKIVSLKIVQTEWLNFAISIKHIKNVFNFFEEDLDDINSLEKNYECLDLDNLTNDSPFKKGYFNTLDELNEKYNNNYKKIEEIVANISSIGSKDSTQCKFEITKDTINILMTKRRYETAKKINSKEMLNYIIESKKDSYRITNVDINYITEEIINLKNEIKSKSDEFYKDFIKYFGNNNFNIIINIIDKISIYDCLICNVNNAIKYNLCKPVISKKKKSYFDIKGIRNPIIEIRTKCVKNDIKLKSNGMLLYGINSSGKSCLMKSVAINILLAQAGMYVFCDNMIFSPYTAIYTRISSSDNIFRGTSSFIREMTELDNILRRANKNSLVVGDEVCAGTENISALSIVASSLLELCKCKCSFLFATHLHELIDIIDSDKILIKHMKINIINDNIEFIRKLEDGDGDKLYGINICRYLKMPNEFLLKAEQIKKTLTDTNHNYVDFKTSNYNSKIYMDYCLVCNINKATETHHIIYQSVDNSNNKNKINNLVPICNECHHKEHHEKSIKIEGFIDTVNGRVLNVINCKEDP